MNQMNHPKRSRAETIAAQDAEFLGAPNRERPRAGAEDRQSPEPEARRDDAPRAEHLHDDAPRAESRRQEAPRAEPRQAEVPQDFVYDNEHPELPVPFTAVIAGHRLQGCGLSVTAAYVDIPGAFDTSWAGRREVVTLEFQFKGFAVTMNTEMIVAGSRQHGEMTLQFRDPLGDHLPQLRYILNSYIAGDFVSMNGLLGHNGPVKPKDAKAEAADDSKRRMRSAAVAVISASLIVLAANVLLNRATQSYEMRPVFIERAGSEMKATTAGQVSYLNPQAKEGEVVFSINANSGDVLNFQLPCDCQVTLAEGIYEGATVLPIDAILSFFDSSVEPRVKTQMSLEGLSKVMSGERVFLEVNDGRTIPVDVVMSSATNTASLRGDDFVPVTLVPSDGSLTKDDIGKTARVRMSKSWFGFAIPSILDVL